MIGARINLRGEYAMRRDERPTRRTNPSGTEVWVARYTRRDGRRVSAGTYTKKGPCKRPSDGCCAQHAIWQAYERDAVSPRTAATVGAYAETWLDLHPRSERSNVELQRRLSTVLTVDLGDGPLGEMLFADVERVHAIRLIDAQLRAGLAVSTVKGRMATLSAMWHDALDDGRTKQACPFTRVKIRANDPRVQAPPRTPTVMSWETMHSIAAAAGPHETMVRVLSDCGLRIGELLPLRRMDVKLGAGACDEAPRCGAVGPHLHVRRQTWENRVVDGTKTGARTVPVAPELARMLGRVTPLDPEGLMFPDSKGKVWYPGDFRRYVFRPACAVVGVKARPHDMRHSWVSLMAAAGVNAADMAKAAGHSVETATRVYTHSVGGMDDALRAAVGS
jgi:integrase